MDTMDMNYKITFTIAIDKKRKKYLLQDTSNIIILRLDPHEDIIY